MARFGALVCAALLFSGCATGITHTVRPGENLYRIGKAYAIDYRKLARINHVGPPYKIKSGQRLFIPGADRQLPVTIITPRAASPRPPAKPPARGSSKLASRGGFSWPVRGRVSSRFGKRARGHHDGIDIAAPRGSSVTASRDGHVIFSDRLSGYGNVIIVEHGDTFTTVYAHNDKNLVRKGAYVRRGQCIATVGATGRATGPHLHFEVRKDNVARNPLFYLPPSATARAGGHA